jgi:hypothetical protein
MIINYDKLHNKILWYYLNPKNHHGKSGFYSGRIIKCDIKKKELITITIITYGGAATKANKGYNSRAMKVYPNEWNAMECCGIVFKGKIIKVKDFLEKYAKGANNG